MERLKNFWNRQEEWCVCSYHPVPYHCICGFNTVQKADEFSHEIDREVIAEGGSRTTLIPTKKFYPNFVKNMDIKHKLNEFVYVEHPKSSEPEKPEEPKISPYIYQHK